MREAVFLTNTADERIDIALGTDAIKAKGIGLLHTSPQCGIMLDAQHGAMMEVNAICASGDKDLSIQTITRRLETSFFGYWPQTLDSGTIDLPSAEWTRYLANVVAIEALGATHAGVFVDSMAKLETADIASKVAALRALNLKFLILGHEKHLRKSTLVPTPDGTNHDNGLDLRFYDTPGLTLDSACAIALMARTCLDPSYVGHVWQTYLGQIATTLEVFGFTNADSYWFDFEGWTWPGPTTAGWYDNCPEFLSPAKMLADSIRCGKSPIDNPTGDLSIACDNFNRHWLNRGEDMTDAVHAVAPLARVFHYNEMSEYQWENRGRTSYMPVGAGDCASPSMYYFDDLTALAAAIDDGSDWNGAIAWISFNYGSKNGANPSVAYAGATRWMKLPDTTASYAAGVLLKVAGFKGACEYPGWSEALFLANSDLSSLYTDYDEFITDWKDQFNAFITGWNAEAHS